MRDLERRWPALAFALLLALAVLSAAGPARAQDEPEDEPVAEESEGEPEVPADDPGEAEEGDEEPDGEGDEEAEEEAADEVPQPEPGGPLVAAAWCVARSGPADEDDLGCDLGLGLALYRRGPLALVSVVGAESVGAGVAWVVARPERALASSVAVALGVVARYGDGGIDTSETYLALGATLSFARPGG